MALLALAGCHKAPPPKEKIHARPKVELVRVGRRTITRTTGQPGFVEAYEQTSLYAKVAGYIDEWKVDIGDTVSRGQEIAHILVPELEAQYREKQAEVSLDEVKIKVAEQAVNVAEHNWKAAIAQAKEAKVTIKRYRADVERWQSEVKRLTGLASEKVVDEQVLLESRKQLKSSSAGQEAAEATAVAAEAIELARKADYDKSKVDVQAARAGARVTKADEERLAALVGYTHIRAPYDGVVVDRNVNTGDYVEPGTGDLSAPRSVQRPNAAPRWPLYVVARTDKVRIFLDVPEMEASGVQKGSAATVRVQAVDDEEIAAKVTRTNWSLHLHTRTLRAEIDLPNPDGRMLPGMYAYGWVEVTRKNVWAVPLRTVTTIGNQDCFYLYGNGKAVQTSVQLGVNDGKWVAVVKKRVGGKWVPFTGKEEVIEADLSELTDGQHVRVDKGGDKEK